MSMPRLSALCFLFPFRLSALPQNIVNVSLDNVIFPRPVFSACHHQRTGLPAALGAFHTPLPYAMCSVPIWQTPE